MDKILHHLETMVETMVETIVHGYLQGESHHSVGFLNGGAGYQISQPSTADLIFLGRGEWNFPADVRDSLSSVGPNWLGSPGLVGATKLLRSHPQLFLELHPYELRERGSSSGLAVRDFLGARLRKN